MATAENPLSKKAIFDNVIGRGSLQFLACEYVLNIANLSYNNGQSSRTRTASRSTRIFLREAGDSIERGRWLNHQVYLGGGWLWYSMYRVCLFKLLYNTCMRYLIQHLASIKHVMIPWCVYFYCEVGKGNGFCRSTSAKIYDYSEICTHVLPSLCLQIS